MKCKYCGHESRSSFSKCPVCHKPVAPAPVFRLSVKKLVRLILILAVLVLAVILAVVFLSSSSPFSGPEQSLLYVEDTDGQLVFIFDGRNAVRTGEELSGKPSKVEMCFSGKYAVILTEARDLYVVSEKGVKKIDDADEVAFFTCAPFADRILFLKNEPGAQSGALFLYELGSSAPARMVDDGVYLQGSEPVISPSGKAFAYVTDYNSSSSTWTLNVSRGDQDDTEKYYSACARAVSDSGDVLFYTDAGGNFYAGDILISDASGTEMEFSIYNINADEALFSLKKGSVYTLVFFRGGKTVSEVTVGSVKNLIVPDYVYSHDGSYAAKDSFVNCALVMESEGYSGDSVTSYYYISDNRLSLEKISPLSGTDLPEASGQLYMTDDGVTVYYRKADQTSIRYMKISDYNSASSELKSDVKVAGFKVSGNGKYVCFRGTDGKLYFNDGSSTVRIADSVYSDEYYVSNNGTVFFGSDYSGAGLTLYVCRKGKEAVAVSGMSSGYKKLVLCDDDRVLAETAYGFYSVKYSSASLITALGG